MTFRENLYPLKLQSLWKLLDTQRIRQMGAHFLSTSLACGLLKYKLPKFSTKIYLRTTLSQEFLRSFHSALSYSYNVIKARKKTRLQQTPQTKNKIQLGCMTLLQTLGARRQKRQQMLIFYTKQLFLFFIKIFYHIHQGKEMCQSILFLE